MPAEWICSPPGLAASVKFIVNTATHWGQWGGRERGRGKQSIALADLSLEPLRFACLAAMPPARRFALSLCHPSEEKGFSLDKGKREIEREKELKGKLLRKTFMAS